LLPLVAVADGFVAIRERPTPAGGGAMSCLTTREREVLRLLMNGFTNAEIGAALGTSRHTVRNQLASIFRKLAVSTRAELVGFVARETMVQSA
jgi:DNA-binding CsgD family transcriptional regulator